MNSLEVELTCTPCGDMFDLRKEERKVVAFFLTETLGLRIEVGCAHMVIEDIDKAVAITAIRTCMMKFMNVWADYLESKKHEG